MAVTSISSLTNSRMSRVAQSRDGNVGPRQSAAICSWHVLLTHANRAGAKPPSHEAGGTPERSGIQSGCWTLTASKTARPMRRTSSGVAKTFSTAPSEARVTEEAFDAERARIMEHQWRL